MLRIFVGTSPNHEDVELEAVLEWSLRKHASDDVEIFWMKLTRGHPALDGWDTSAWATPFTPFRWIVPELCDFTGRAIYCDVDFLFLDDPATLINQPIPDGKIALSKSPTRTCCTVWDCAAAREWLPPIEKMKREPEIHRRLRDMMRDRGLTAQFERNWNCLDGEKMPVEKIQALHFTSMPHQPHLERARERLAKAGRVHWFDGIPNRHWRRDVIELFERYFVEAERLGYTPDRYTRDPIYGDFRKRSLGGLGRQLPSWAGRPT